MIELPQKAVDAANQFVKDQDEANSIVRQVSFVVPTLNANQMGLALSHNLNKAIRKDPYTEYSVYSVLKEPPAILPEFAIYNSSDCMFLRTPLIATDYASWEIVNNSVSKFKYYYVYDVSIFKKANPQVISTIKNSKFCMFTRSKEHAQFLSKFGFKCYGLYVPNFELDGIMEILNVTTSGPSNSN